MSPIYNLAAIDRISCRWRRKGVLENDETRMTKLK